MTTRVRYSHNMNEIVSHYYLVGNLQVRVRITPYPNMVYWIEDNDGDILHSGYANSIRMCKVNAKATLKKLGVVFEEEMRK